MGIGGGVDIRTGMEWIWGSGLDIRIGKGWGKGVGLISGLLWGWVAIKTVVDPQKGRTPVSKAVRRTIKILKCHFSGNKMGSLSQSLSDHLLQIQLN